jgi:acyl-coenzyme A synthetase/AMP-(fatty) acid ligase
MTPYRQLYRHSIENPESFWREQASLINWFKSPETILSRDGEGLYRWYSDGVMNTCYLAIDKHIEEGRGDQIALIYDSPVTNTIKKYTYNELYDNVSFLAGGLLKLGVQKGDRVVIYMPLVPEAVFSMLACARIGAVHSVVFGGFAPHELAVRIDDAQPKVIISASCGIEIDRVIAYKPMLDDAISKAIFKPQHTVILQRPMMTAEMWPGRDVDYNELVENATAADCVMLNANDPLYILYTSGTTGKPKGILRDNGGHAVALRFSMDHIYNVKAGDVFWAASDVGWVVGHSYMVYGPLMQGCTTLLYEGKPVRTPDAGAFWRVVEQHKVNILFTAPTAFRAIKKEDPDGELLHKYDISSLHRLYLAGERCDVPTWYWATEMLKVPVIDHWWQTESGWPIVAQMPSIDEQMLLKPGSAGKPIPGYKIDILNEDGEQLIPNQEGFVAIKLPLPPGCLPDLYNDTDRFISSYLEKFPGYYLTGDGGYKDEEDYVFIMGRVDDVINVAGHRLSTGEMEEMVAAHSFVAECAVVGIADELKGHLPLAYVVVRDGIVPDELLIEKELVKLIRENIGAVACFKNCVLVKRLPKTRSGKILRRLLRNIADGEHYIVPSTIDDPLILTEVHDALKARRIGQAFIGVIDDE